MQTFTYEPVTRKPVFGVCNQVRLKPACSATGTSQGLEILDIASIVLHYAANNKGADQPVRMQTQVFS